MFKVGTVVRYYETVGTALVELDGAIAIHDTVKFVLDHNDLFSQKVEIIQVGHTKVDSANRGSVVALKTNEMVKAGTQIFKES